MAPIDHFLLLCEVTAMATLSIVLTPTPFLTFAIPRPVVRGTPDVLVLLILTPRFVSKKFFVHTCGLQVVVIP